MSEPNRNGRTTEERAIPALVHGRYLLEAPAELAEKRGLPLLLVFHGYAESAERSLEAMRRIPGSEGWVLCAVQALHPFYNRANDVVANWMTRQDRDRAIRDNQRYAGSVLTEVRAELPACDRWAYLGFSQGGAMAYRAAVSGPPGARGVVILGSDLPPEIEGPALAALPPVLLGRGDREEWYDEKKLAADLERLRAAGVDVRPVAFAGGHEWTEEFLGAAGAFLAERFT
jgi:predicted esterase